MTNEQVQSSESLAVDSELHLSQLVSIKRIMITAMSTRAVHDVAVRMVYPFLPEIAAGHLDRAGGIDGFIA